MVATLLRYSIGGPFVECKKPVDVQELAYCLATQTRRDPPLCPPEFETLMSIRLLPDVLRLSKEEITNLKTARKCTATCQLHWTLLLMTSELHLCYIVVSCFDWFLLIFVCVCPCVCVT